MAAQTSMLHVRVNDQVKNEAAQKLEGIGLTLSDAVRILFSRATQMAVTRRTNNCLLSLAPLMKRLRYCKSIRKLWLDLSEWRNSLKVLNLLSGWSFLLPYIGC